MTTMVPRQAESQTDVIAVSLARRARELARDPRVTLGEGAQHLVRLAKGRTGPLDRALAELRRDPLEDAEREHARILLRRALGDAARAPADGSGAGAAAEVLHARVHG